ncbi:MAG: substrate-binding domain-containing protein [Pseudomonadota bacterium]
MKVTARDIASKCGTSISAVSRAFRADGSIHPDLRRRILDEAASLGYTPPARRARMLREAVSFAIVIGEIGNPFNASTLMRFSSSAASAGWVMTTFVVPTSGEMDSVIEQVLAADLDVVVLASAELSSGLAKECRERGLPVIYFNRIQVDADMIAVCTDNYGGGQLAAERLLAAGRERFAFVGGRIETSTHLERRRGFLDALKAAGVSLDHDEVGNFDYETALGIGRDLFNRSPAPDGIFCANDNMGFALIDAADAVGLRPGEDVSIIGYDDVPMARWNRYQLTTISQQVDHMVAHTVELIGRAAQGTALEGVIEVVAAKLVARQSG